MGPSQVESKVNCDAVRGTWVRVESVRRWARVKSSQKWIVTRMGMRDMGASQVESVRPWPESSRVESKVDCGAHGHARAG